jgi:hypothetical protein
MSLDRDWRIRLAALEKITELRRLGGGLVRAAAANGGFAFKHAQLHSHSR